MTRIGEVLDDMRRAREGEPRRFVHVDCESSSGSKWCHLVSIETAEETVRAIEQRWRDVKATVRR